MVWTTSCLAYYTGNKLVMHLYSHDEYPKRNILVVGTYQGKVGSCSIVIMLWTVVFTRLPLDMKQQLFVAIFISRFTKVADKVLIGFVRIFQVS